MITPCLVADDPSEAVTALLTAAATPAPPRPPGAWTLGYVDAAGIQRTADLASHTARIREYAERHHLSLISTYVDRPDEMLGFGALLAAIERHHPDRVLVTALAHLDAPAPDPHATETRHDRLRKLGVRIEQVFP
ncbi:recombinase family protein [Kribbella italica]|uniref:Recombinase family protein n=1 Tax=Kribbella italica TaxID=1540520 RepID=A0A7W9J5P7_9ACTN|nr:recombinase family protein [Kribbella italica]MBB5835988.1 hypothetical protein [Kribbella italica]